MKGIATNDNEYKQNDLTQLAAALTLKFPIDHSKAGFRLYPFSNECFYAEALDILKDADCNRSGISKLALLVGESNFISILPELLAVGTNAVLMADIEPLLHSHTKHLVNCLFQADTPEEFISCYKKNNPLAGKEYIDDNGRKSVWDIEGLTMLLTNKFRGVSSLQTYFFLTSQERYNQCKSAASQLKFIHIEMDLFKIEQCRELANSLNDYDAQLSLCNLTNLHHYDEKSQLKQTIPLLLEKSPECYLMYTCDEIEYLDTNISKRLEDYFSRKQTFTRHMPVVETDFELEDDFILDLCHNQVPCSTGPSKPFISNLLSQHGFYSDSSLKREAMDTTNAREVGLGPD